MSTQTETPPAPSWDINFSDRERTSSGTWLTVEYKNLPVDELGHQFTSQRGNGTVDGAIVLTSSIDVSQFMSHTTFSCQKCDAFPSFEFFDDAEHGPRLVYVDRISRPAPDDITCPISEEGLTWDIELAVPSGKMIVSDDLRPVYNIPLRHEVDVPGYSSTLGHKLHSEEHAAIGCAFGPTSNIGLGLYKLTDPEMGEDRYAIITPDYGNEDEPIVPFGGVEVANICTDLWAYSIADFEHWRARAAEWVTANPAPGRMRYDDWVLADWLAAGADIDQLPDDLKIVDVTPGTYRFNYLGGRPGFAEEPDPLVWATVELIK